MHLHLFTPHFCEGEALDIPWVAVKTNTNSFESPLMPKCNTDNAYIYTYVHTHIHVCIIQYNPDLLLEFKVYP